MESQRNVTYHKNKKTKQKHNRHQHNTNDGGQAMGEKMRHVQMSSRKWGKHTTGEGSEQQ